VTKHSKTGEWEELSFDEAVEPISDEGKRVDQRDYEPSGALPVIDQGESLVGGYTNDLSKSYTGPLPIVVFGDHTRRVKLINEPFAVGAQGVKLLRPRYGWSAKFFAYLLPTLPIPNRGYSRHYQFVRKLTFPRPPLDEQQRIVAEIEKQFTRLDAGVASLKRVQTALKRYRASVLKAACEGRLVSTEAELARKENRSYETGEQLLQRILKKRREKWNGMGRYKGPASIEPGTPPMIAEGWALASAEAVCSSVRDGTHDTPAYVAQGIPLITSKNLLPTGLDFENVKFISREDHAQIGKRSGVQRGDILFAMIGTIGNPVVVETDRAFSIKNVGLFKANPGFILSRYLQYWFTSPQFMRWLGPKQKGTTQKFVPLALLRSLVVALPPLAEQTRIVAEVEAKLSIVDELEMMATSQFRRVTRLRQSILQQAFEGKLTGKNNILD
jgi:type I restriction enzyme S subunit